MHIRIGVFLLRMYIGTNRISEVVQFSNAVLDMVIWTWFCVC